MGNPTKKQKEVIRRLQAGEKLHIGSDLDDRCFFVGDTYKLMWSTISYLERKALIAVLKKEGVIALTDKGKRRIFNPEKVDYRDEKGRLLKGHKLLNGFGENSRAWKGEKISYSALHNWLWKNFKKKRKCEKCGTETAKTYDWANISGLYKRDRTDYMELCRPCHFKMDKDRSPTCKHGHEKTPENIRITKEGWRVCRKCTNESQRKYTKNKSNDK